MSIMKRLAAAVIVFMAVSMSACFVYAEEGAEKSAPQAETGDYRAQAKDLLIDGEYQESYDLLMKNYEANKDDVETNFLLGQVTMALDRPEDAIVYYKGILARDPSLQRVRLELARAYASNRQRELAKMELESVMATKPPKVVGDNIQKYLAALSAQKDWSLRATVGYLFDSNVNVGPGSDTVQLFGTSFVLSPSSRAQADHGITANLDLNYLKPFSRKFALQGEAQYNHAGYFNLDMFDTDIFSLSAGPSFKDTTLTASIPLLFNYIMIGSERYSYAYGISPQAQYSITQNLLATVTWTGQIQEFYRNSGRTGTVWSINSGLKYFIETRGFVQAGYRHSEEETRQAFLDNTADAINLGAYIVLPAGFSAFVQEQVSFSGYDDKEAAFPHARKDVQYVTNLNLAKGIGKSGFSLGAGYTFTRNDSNIDLFDYRRHQVTVQLSKSF